MWNFKKESMCDKLHTSGKKMFIALFISLTFGILNTNKASKENMNKHCDYLSGDLFYVSFIGGRHKMFY